MKSKKLEESKFLSAYNPRDFDSPIISVDTVIYTVIDDSLQVLLVKRANHPFMDQWSLVGGFVDLDLDTDIEQTAKRKLKEKTGIDAPYLEQLSTVGNKVRDPRYWSITTVYFALLPADKILLQVGVGASDIKWSKVKNGSVKESLAFDHANILQKCTERLKSKALYTSLPLYLMPEEFSITDLQRVYESILEQKLPSKSFRRRILNANILEETNREKSTARRPAKLYKNKADTNPFFFLRNIEALKSLD